MSKFISLLRATMSEGIQLFNYRNNRERSGQAVPSLLALFVGVVVLISATVMTAKMKESGNELTILSIYTLITVLIIVTEGIYKSGDLLFKPRDNDTLLAMPIKKSTIVTIRIIKFYAFEMLYCLIFLLPAMVAYAINAEVGVTFLLTAITMLLFTPVIPIAISCIVGLIVSATTARFGKYRTFLQVILSFAALIIFAVLILKISTATEIDGQLAIRASESVIKYYYPASAFISLVANFSFGQYILFVVINLVVLVATVSIISRFYFHIVTNLETIRRTKNAGLNYKYKRHHQIVAIVKKEINRYFSTPVLMMNTAIGLALFLVAVGALCIKYDDIATSMMSSVENFPLTIDLINTYLPSIAFILVAFTSLMTFITSTMISLEGRAFNLLKSMPVSGRKVIMGKVLAAMLLIVPVTLLGSIAMFIRFHFSIVDIVLILIGVIVLPLVTELIGILVNLKYANFNAESDAVVVKQSASVMVATFLGLGTVLATISLTVAIVLVAGQTVGLIIIDAIFGIIAMFLSLAVATRGEEKYAKLSA